MSPDPRDAVIARLENENDALRGRIEQLEEELSWAGHSFPLEWCLSPKEAKMLSALSGRQVCSKEYLHTCLYGLDPGGGAELKIIDVFICKLRSKLKPFDLKIGTLLGNGYFLEKDSRAVVLSYIHKREVAHERRVAGV